MDNEAFFQDVMKPKPEKVKAKNISSFNKDLLKKIVLWLIRIAVLAYFKYLMTIRIDSNNNSKFRFANVPTF